MMAIAFFLFGMMCTVLEGFVLKTMWGWFLVPQFGFPQIGAAHAVGLALLIGMVTHQTPDSDSDEKMSRILIYGVLGPVITLAAGFVAKQFL